MLGKIGQHILAAGIGRHGILAGLEITPLHDGTHMDGAGLVHLANEFLDMLIGRLEHDILGPAFLLHRPVLKHGDAVGKLERLEEFEQGAVYKHWPAKTVTEADDHLFCLITMNHHPLHINDVYAAQSQQGRNVVVGPLVYSLALGMSVGDVSGKAIANLATDELSHPAPVFHGDTLFCESEVLEVRPSQSKPDRGIVRVHTRVLNQDGTLVAEFKRSVLVPRKEPG